ncbi:MOSC domain-containing protein [Candidatus Poribacteria bacterium]|jgi:hypothetical protein|nr:MOSC domain-containing protein [Candidatus Poribacteria bacterium]MBT5535372.1 MOSC domain-containing protein [Candidatus Poribacteria bacterium]MBT5714362.1 MOSC domain-containing protein [Candidatus Poribacteria bacterium]MBT7097543.1 MOSC domain-containing protein [Candidatus Poribacteria bacterium]MBT7804894.1 MOSC domain-containing protein [Candidatus Poribacteria bacterium]
MPDIDHAPMHLTAEQIDARLDWIEASPADSGTLEGICIRPEPNEREELESCLLSPELGVEGDFWVRNCWKKLEDGSSDPAVQLALMNCRAVDVVAGSRDRWKWAGDQLFVDFDLGEDNLSPGDRLHIGSAVVELSDIPHTGCDLFKARYGMAAVKFINSRTGKEKRLRGVLAQIVQAGTVSVGDTVRKADSA